MATRHQVTAQELLAPGHFNVFSFGAFIGFEWTSAKQGDANFFARRFLEDLSLLPKRDDVVFCERQLPGPSSTSLVCGEIMHSAADDSTGLKLGFRWRCRGPPGRRHPTTWLNPTHGTIYFHSQLEFRKMLKLIYCWFKGTNVTIARDEYGVTDGTACRWYQWWRESLSTVAWHDFEKIGGPGDIVEIDETNLFTRKNRVGRLLVSEQYWVFGGVSRTTGRRFAMRVALRNVPALGAEILDCIAAGTFICTDGWAAYNSIANLPLGLNARFYSGHGVVLHNTNFIFPPTGVDPLWLRGFNTACEDRLFVGPHPPPDPLLGPFQPIRYHIQKSERTRRDLKTHVKSTRDVANVDSYIGEWMYRHNILSTLVDDDGVRFKRVMDDIYRVYPGANITPIRANRPGFSMFATGNATLCDCDDCAQ